MRRIIGFLVNFAVIATLVSVGGPLTLSADDDRVQNCLDILIAFPGASDGEYFIEPREDQKFMIYCHDMASGNPRQYLTLINTGFPFNYSQYTAGGFSQELLYERLTPKCVSILPPCL